MFPGDLVSEIDLERLQVTASKIEGILDDYPEEVFDVITIAKEVSNGVTYMDVPLVLRPTWAR